MGEGGDCGSGGFGTGRRRWGQGGYIQEMVDGGGLGEEAAGEVGEADAGGAGDEGETMTGNQVGDGPEDGELGKISDGVEFGVIVALEQEWMVAHREKPLS